MNKDLLMAGIYEAVENTKAIRDEVDKSMEKLLKKERAKQQRFTICCKAKDLNKELKRLEPVLRKILN